MATRNPARDIAISLAAASLFAVGLLAYLWPRTIGSKPAPSLLASSAVEGPTRADARGDDARRIGTTFVQQLSMAHFEEAYRLMASAYRRATPFSAFHSACMGSPFLSSAQTVSLSKTREVIAPGDDRGALTASGVMTTGAGPVEVRFSFVDDGTGLGIVNLTVAGTPAFPMGAAAIRMKSAPSNANKKP
jgi:hypothetical protein